MRLSRIALASLISLGVLGGVSSNASASHHQAYQKVLWNKAMAHHKVGLKNGKGIIWNKPYKTSKNSKIKYRISHKKGLVLTTLRHMKVKSGTIYYFVKGGKISGWINKNSVKLIKNKGGKVTPITNGDAKPGIASSQSTPAASGASNSVNTVKPANSASQSSQSTSSISSYPSQPSTVVSGKSKVTNKVEKKRADQPDSEHAFDTYTEGEIADTSWVYHQTWDSKDNTGKPASQVLAARVKKGTKILIALNDPHDGHKQVMIKTADGKISGYVDWSQIKIGTGSNAVTPAPEPVKEDKSTSDKIQPKETEGPKDSTKELPGQNSNSGSPANGQSKSDNNASQK